MSHAVLRSVSPVHIEYLKNMGVGASMSVSLVINGRLWGLIACHHMSRKLVPYAIRMAAEVLAQVIASTIHSIGSGQETGLVEQAAACPLHSINMARMVLERGSSQPTIGKRIQSSKRWRPCSTHSSAAR